MYFLLINLHITLLNAGERFSFKNLSIKWGVLQNNYEGKTQFLHHFILENQGNVELPSSGWVLYFNFNRKTVRYIGDFDLIHINGDFFKIQPNEKFLGLKPGEKVEIKVISELWVLKYSDAPCGFYAVWNQNPQIIEPISDYSILPFDFSKIKRISNDSISDYNAETVYYKNKFIKELKSGQIPYFIPRPVSEIKIKGNTRITDNVEIIADSMAYNEACYLQSVFKKFFNKEIKIVKSSENKISKIYLIIDKKISPNTEAYQLIVHRNIVIRGSSEKGIFYGIQSLLKIIPYDAFSKRPPNIILPNVEIFDEPRFSYRGVHLDVARNFQTKETIFKFLDLMALYKLNKFHFHLTDDEGWRLEIPTLPELTQIGSKRAHTIDEQNNLMPSFCSGPFMTGNYGNGYYTKQDFIEILKYAKARHIEVIPEIDIPGHSRAAIVAMKRRYQTLLENNVGINIANEINKIMIFDPNDQSEYRSVQMWNDNVMCMCHEATFNFYREVIHEIKKMYDEAGVTLHTIHTGGDEVPNGVWEKSPICSEFLKNQSKIKKIDEIHDYYIEKVSTILSEYGLVMGGWEEIALKKRNINEQIIYEPNEKFLDKNLLVYVWNNVWGWGQEDFAYKLANLGYKVILSNATNLYLDLAYNSNPEEPGYYWAGFCDVDKTYSFHPFDYFKTAIEDRFGNKLNKNLFQTKERLTKYGKSNIVGIQGHLWSENIKGQDLLEYFAIPKLLGLAERAWSKMPSWGEEETEQNLYEQLMDDYTIFLNVIGHRELKRLAFFNGGYTFRIPSPGIVEKDGKIYMNIQYPGLKIRYTTNGSEPTVKSSLYKGPIKGAKQIKAKCYDIRGRHSSMIEYKIK
jgi:hexosaminidase